MFNEQMSTAAALHIAVISVEQMEKELYHIRRENQDLKRLLDQEHQAKIRLRKENGYLEKEREMLWKTVDRLSGAENKGDS